MLKNGVMNRLLVLVINALTSAFIQQVIVNLSFNHRDFVSDGFFKFEAVFARFLWRQASIPKIDNKGSPHGGALERVALFFQHFSLLIQCA